MNVGGEILEEEIRLGSSVVVGFGIGVRVVEKLLRFGLGFEWRESVVFLW